MHHVIITGASRCLGRVLALGLAPGGRSAEPDRVTFSRNHDFRLLPRHQPPTLLPMKPQHALLMIMAGWLVIAADTDLGNPWLEDNERATGSDLAVHLQAVAALAKAWPGSKSWEFACCGHSGGAKASFYRVGDLLAAGLKVTGMYLSGCNQDLTADAREETKCSKAGLHKVNVFVSSGKADTIATTAHAENLAKSTKEDFGKIRLEHHDGGHSIDQAEFKKALEWFQSPDPKAKR